MSKKKEVFDKDKSDQKKAIRIPTSKKGFDFKDKKKYTRKKKHKKGFIENTKMDLVDKYIG